MRADNSRHLIKAAQQRAEQTRRRAVAALRGLDTTGKPISFESVTREARVSRSWLCAQAVPSPRGRASPRAPAEQPVQRSTASRTATRHTHVLAAPPRGCRRKDP